MPRTRNINLLLSALALTLPLGGARAQQWTINNLPPGFIARWQADGNQLDLARAIPSFAPGRVGHACQFNGTDQPLGSPHSQREWQVVPGTLATPMTWPISPPRVPHRFFRGRVR